MAHLKLNTKQWLQLGKKLGYIKKAQEEGAGLQEGLEGLEGLGDATTDMPDMPGMPGDAPVAAPGIPEMEDPGSLCMSFKSAGAGNHFSAFIDHFSNGDSASAWKSDIESFSSESRQIADAWGNEGRSHKRGSTGQKLFEFYENGMKCCKTVSRGSVNKTLKDMGFIVFRSPKNGIPLQDNTESLFNDIARGTEAEMPMDEFVKQFVEERGQPPLMFISWSCGLTGSKFTEYQECIDDKTCP
jgi:hypothetical protein